VTVVTGAATARPVSRARVATTSSVAGATVPGKRSGNGER
jgi:hypothetical protein